MAYEPRPDRKLVALVLLAMVVFPVMIVAELKLPGFQPALASSRPAGPSGPPPGSNIKPVSVVMPNGISVNSKLNFQPSTIVVVIGVNNTVVWTNSDSADHSVTFLSVPSGVSAASISNADVPPGTTFSVTFTVPGTYSYHCTFHPLWMRGTVIVKSG